MCVGCTFSKGHFCWTIHCWSLVECDGDESRPYTIATQRLWTKSETNENKNYFYYYYCVLFLFFVFRVPLYMLHSLYFLTYFAPIYSDVFGLLLCFRYLASSVFYFCYLLCTETSIFVMCRFCLCNCKCCRSQGRKKAANWKRKQKCTAKNMCYWRPNVCVSARSNPNGIFIRRSNSFGADSKQRIGWTILLFNVRWWTDHEITETATTKKW